MVWKQPDRADLENIVRSARNSLLICSPYISRVGVDVVSSALQPGLGHIEIWTRLDSRDWLTGAADPEALLDFLERLASSMSIALYTSSALHAKLILADKTRALVGSANLTRGGFYDNIEIIRLVEPPEIDEVNAYVESSRHLLSLASLHDLREFVTRCENIAKDREALLDLVREVAPRPPPGVRPLIPLGQFINFCSSYAGEAPDNIRVIFYNADGNNRTGHLKQAYYAVQRFFQEYPQHLDFVANQPHDTPFDIRGTPIELDWQAFIGRFAGDRADAFTYDLSILVGSYLTPAYGGTRLGGGGGDYPFKLVWPLVARMMVQQQW